MQQRLSRHEQSRIRGGGRVCNSNIICTFAGGQQFITNYPCSQILDAYNDCYTRFGGLLECAICPACPTVFGIC